MNVLSRFLTFFLALSLSLPNSAFALRVQNGGLEERAPTILKLEAALLGDNAVAPTTTTAGLEEKVSLETMVMASIIFNQIMSDHPEIVSWNGLRTYAQLQIQKGDRENYEIRSKQLELILGHLQYVLVGRDKDANTLSHYDLKLYLLTLGIQTATLIKLLRQKTITPQSDTGTILYQLTLELSRRRPMTDIERAVLPPILQGRFAQRLLEVISLDEPPSAKPATGLEEKRTELATTLGQLEETPRLLANPDGVTEVAGALGLSSRLKEAGYPEGKMLIIPDGPVRADAFQDSPPITVYAEPQWKETVRQNLQSRLDFRFQIVDKPEQARVIIGSEQLKNELEFGLLQNNQTFLVVDQNSVSAVTKNRLAWLLVGGELTAGRVLYLYIDFENRTAFFA